MCELTSRECPGILDAALYTVRKPELFEVREESLCAQLEMSRNHHLAWTSEMPGATNSGARRLSVWVNQYETWCWFVGSSLKAFKLTLKTHSAHQRDYLWSELSLWLPVCTLQTNRASRVHWYFENLEWIKSLSGERSWSVCYLMYPKHRCWHRTGSQ